MSPSNFIDQFRAVLEVHGIVIDGPIEADGRIHRCAVVGGKSGRQDGSYVLHADGLPAGGFINWKSGEGWQTWCAQRDQEPSREDRAAWKAQQIAIRQQRQAEESMRHAEAAERAVRLWGGAKPATNDHPYLQRKEVGAYGVRQLGEQLLIPVRDADGMLTSLQFISPAGDKRFLTGGRKRGCYFAIGLPRHVLCICEGYATAASIFEATGYATAVAFDAGNLEAVAKALRAKFPALTIVICADNDSQTPGNPGISCAVVAAKAVGGRVAVPQFLGACA